MSLHCPSPSHHHPSLLFSDPPRTDLLKTATPDDVQRTDETQMTVVSLPVTRLAASSAPLAPHTRHLCQLPASPLGMPPHCRARSSPASCLTAELAAPPATASCLLMPLESTSSHHHPPLTHSHLTRPASPLLNLPGHPHCAAAILPCVAEAGTTWAELQAPPAVTKCRPAILLRPQPTEESGDHFMLY